jgi:PhzF family phenazine biosynthesis protein
VPTLLFHVDAFTRAPFRGNPAAVVILDGPRDEAWMQAVAREMNVSETAFATLLPSGAFALRWFTPLTEVPLCGHATLATAAVLLSQGVVAGEVAFDTQSGRLTVTAEGNGYRLDLPALTTEPTEAPEIVAALGAQALEVRASREGRKWLVRVASAAEVRGLAPEMSRLLDAPNPLGLKGLVVTAPGSGDPSESGAHFVSRYFAPWVGVPEDPVTGSAHALLGPYWAGHLGRTRMLAAQLSRRGGEVGVEVVGDRVQLTGSCVVLSRGFWLE